jgi:G3E family GTPase
MKHLDDISITDDLSSHAVGSEDEGNDARETLNSAGFDSTSQLIMPSIRMPSRRPFTDRGKTMGRFKVLIAGACGSGKTSLIKSIVQACEDIVHVDPFPSLSPSNLSARAQPPTTAAVISEIYASTKPYPPWWSDLEDSRVLRRRKSSGDIVLERNLCFVDTAGNGSSRVGQTDAIIRHIQQQLLRATTAVNSSNTDFENLLAGNGGAQVDAVLYLISENTLAADIECIRKLCAWTNVIPLISKSDLLTPDQIATLKSSFHAKAQMASIKPFHFGDATSAAADGFSSHSPFAISSAKVDDEDVMDASTLMSPDYVQPLAPSELSLLVQKLFDLDNMAWIRHSAAKKLVQRQHDQGQQWEVSRHSTNPFDGQSTVSRSTSSVISASYLEGITSPPSGRFPSYTMARISDYTQREEKMARVQLAKWASDLQRSLQNERERYAALARGERAVWLTERLGECVVDGSLVPITKTPGFCGLRLPTDNAGGRLFVRTQDGKKMEYRVTSISPHDPLGIVWWSDDLKQRGWAIVQIVGSLGVVGGLAFWLAKAWGLSSRSLSEWRFDCCSTCN